MEYLEFETLNFIQRGRRKIGLIPKNVFTITSNGKTLLGLCLVES